MIQTIRHTGGGTFEATMTNGEIRKVGESLSGMIRYTYFENYVLPPADWSVEHMDLLRDYHQKISRQILEDRKPVYMERKLASIIS